MGVVTNHLLIGMMLQIFSFASVHSVDDWNFLNFPAMTDSHGDWKERYSEWNERWRCTYRIHE